MKKIMAIILSVFMMFAFTAVYASAASGVAAIGAETYETLSAALADCTAGDTITLLDDVTEDVTVSKNITLDGADKQYTGVISVSAGKTVTVQNVKFVGGRVEANSKSTANNLTVKNCTFEGSLSNYSIIINSGSKLTIENCKAKDIGMGLAYAKNSVSNIVLKDVEVDGATYGLNMVNNVTTVFENVTMTNVTRGLQFQTNSSKTITFINCTISVTDNENAAPVYISHKANTTQTLIFKGDNDFGTDDYTFGSSLAKVIRDAAAIGSEKYATINEAIAAAEDGDVIKVICDHTIANDDIGEKVSGMYPYIAVTDKKVTIDLNGKTISVNPSLDAKMLAVFYAGGTGELTLTDSSEAQSGTVNVVMADGTEAYSMFTVLGVGAKMSIESGNYTIDKVDYGQSMLYAGQNEQMFVSGGNFVLGNAKSKDPGNGALQPWMFNAHGDGIKVIIVSGGTYNVDPTHYHGETSFPGCYASVENDDGTWTVKEIHTLSEAVVENSVDADCVNDGSYDTVIYCTDCDAEVSRETTVVEAFGHTASAAATCQSAQYCIVCGEELDAIKEHTLGEYVSNKDATCQNDGTKTAYCIYDCGLSVTVVDEGTIKEHVDGNNNGNCDYCSGELCTICGRLHKDTIADLLCLLGELIRLLFLFLKTVS